MDDPRSWKEARRGPGERQSNGVEARGGAGGDKCLRAMVSLLAGLEVEGVFRTVVGFL